MDKLGEWVRRLIYLINRRRIEGELQREMQAHREMMGEPERFGNLLRLREEARDVWGWNWLDAISRDVTYAVRSLRRSPGLAVTAVLILGGAIGINLAFFQIINLTLLRPLQVRDPDTLVRFDRMSVTQNATSISSTISYPLAQFIRANSAVLSTVMTHLQNELVWGDDATDRIRGAFVSADWFDELGYTAAYGRLFHEDLDESGDAVPVVLLGEEFWTSRLGRDPRILGTTVLVNDRPAMIVGIVPAGFRGLQVMQQEVKVWLPMYQIDYFIAESNFKTDWGRGGPAMYGRLRPGINLAAAKESLRTLMAEIAHQRPTEFTSGEWLEPHSAAVYFDRPDDYRLRRSFALLVAGLFVIVLLIACTNLSAIILSRGVNRIRELSVRAGRYTEYCQLNRSTAPQTVVFAPPGRRE